MVLRLPRLLGSGPGLGHPGGEHEVLAQRVALEAVRQQQRLEIGVALEVDAEHLEGLALVPGGAAVDAGGRGQPGPAVGALGHAGAQDQPAGPAEAPGPVVGRADEGGHEVALLELVHAGEPVQEVGAQPVARGRERVHPALGRDGGEHAAVLLDDLGRLAEDVLDPLQQLGVLSRHSGPAPRPGPRPPGRTAPSRGPWPCAAHGSSGGAAGACARPAAPRWSR